LDYTGFGSIRVAGERFDHDIVIDAGSVRPRDKAPSRERRHRAGHTPLTTAEDLPWSGTRLVIGTGASGMLPVQREIEKEAAARSVELIAIPTAEACELLRSVDDREVHAILHVTC
jgi:hypothetical protein